MTIKTVQDADVDEVLRLMRRRDKLKERIGKVKKMTEKWALLRQIYMEHMPEIWAASEEDITAQIDPYFVDWLHEMTPIEFDAWQSIRGKGLPLYPQFPVFNYFIDFANPYLRIGVELDGRQWHDAEKDRKRDSFLADFGWRIFRIAGYETSRSFELPPDARERGASDDEILRAEENWILNTSDGVFEALRDVYFQGQPDARRGLCLNTLDRHRLADFPLTDDEWESMP